MAESQIMLSARFQFDLNFSPNKEPHKRDIKFITLCILVSSTST